MDRVSKTFRKLDPGSQWVVYTLLGMAGLWGTAVLFLMHVNDPPWLALIDRGQLFLYSMGFLTSSLYLVQREWATTNVPYRGWLLTGCISALIISMLLFSGGTLASTTTELKHSPVFGAIVGGLVLLYSLAVGYLVIRAEEAKMPFDIDEELEKRKLRIQEEYEKALQAAEGESS